MNKNTLSNSQIFIKNWIKKISKITYPLEKYLDIPAKNGCIICAGGDKVICSDECIQTIQNIYFNERLEFKFHKKRNTKHYHKQKELLKNYVTEENIHNLSSNSKIQTNPLKYENNFESSYINSAIDYVNENHSSAPNHIGDEFSFIVENIYFALYGINGELEFIKLHDKDGEIDKIDAFILYEKNHLYLESIYFKSYKSDLVLGVLEGKIEADPHLVIANIPWFLYEKRYKKDTLEVLAKAITDFSTLKEKDLVDERLLLHNILLYSGLKESRHKKYLLHDAYHTTPFPSEVLIDFFLQKKEYILELMQKNKQSLEIQKENERLKKSIKNLGFKIKKQERELESLEDMKQTKAENKQLREKNKALQETISHKQKEINNTNKLVLENQQLQKKIHLLKNNEDEEKSKSDYILKYSTLVHIFPKNSTEILENASSVFSDRLIISPDAILSSKDIELDNQTLIKSWRALESLANILWEQRFRGNKLVNEKEFKNQTGIDITMAESPGVKKDKNLMNIRRRIYKENTFYISAHIKIGTKIPKLLRIHFAFIENEEKIYIGHFGSHLKTVISGKIS